MTTSSDDWAGLWRSNANPYLFLSSAASVLNYALQPIVDINSGEVYGYEALLRNVDQVGFNSPVEVFDFAASTRCLTKLELLLRRMAIEKYASLKDRGSAKLFINVDARLLQTDGFLLPETVAMLAHHGLKPSDLCLELSETYDTEASGQVKDFIARARKIGFAFAIDDFGKGYSQLKSLHEFEPDILKIDRFFISTIQSDARKRLLVASLVDLAHVLGMRVVAEGVETEAELSVCREVGCDLVQGYLIAHPLLHLDEVRTRYDMVSTVRDRDRRKNQSDEDLVRREIKPLVTLKDDARMQDVLALFRRGKNHPFIPIVNAVDEPRGVIREADIKDFIYMPFGQDLLYNPAFNNQLTNFLHRCPVADLHSRLDQLIGMIANDVTGGIIITKNGRYYGFLTTSSLLKISNEIRMRAAEEQNPLTRLPGNSAVTSFVAEEAANADIDRCFCYLDFDNFKPFNDTYGFRTGDRAILLFSELMKRFTAGNDDFIGHVGGDDFFIGTKRRDTGETAQLMRDLRAEFGHQAESFYDPQHRTDGYIFARDRSGTERRFPLLSCSVAILHLPAGLSVENQDLLGRQIASLKREAKASKQGVAAATFGDRPAEGASAGPSPKSAGTGDAHSQGGGGISINAVA